MPVVIDGYNLLRSIQKTVEEPDSISDIVLCRILSAYLNSINQSGTIVFDGIGPPEKSVFANVRNLEVIFSGRNCEADAIIENLITANTAPKLLTVVSSDQRLRKAAKVRKAIAVKSEDFWPIVQKQLSRSKKTFEPPAKRKGLTESETDQWLKIFHLDQ